MAKLVLLVVGAAWAAVLLPPMLRSRVDNRPNSSVTDFRRQLSKLQATAAPHHRNSMRAMGRPLAQSPLQRPAAAGRPGHALHRQASLRAGTGAPAGAPTRPTEYPQHPEQSGYPEYPEYPQHDVEPARYRTHGDPSARQTRPPAADRSAPHDPYRAQARRRPAHHHRRATMARPVDPAATVKRRRTNVLFVLVVTTACTMFLAATTKSTALLYVFALSFLALCGYVYLLAQLRQRQGSSWNDGWLDNY
jgi:hypothetical protein